MVVEVNGGDEFLAHRITGGLSKNEYVRSNISTLFPELIELRDGAHEHHPILKGFQVDTDNRGYTSLITMNKVAVRAFSARFNFAVTLKM